MISQSKKQKANWNIETDQIQKIQPNSEIIILDTNSRNKPILIPFKVLLEGGNRNRNRV